jgi:hypothetical protein
MRAHPAEGSQAYVCSCPGGRVCSVGSRRGTPASATSEAEPPRRWPRTMGASFKRTGMKVMGSILWCRTAVLAAAGGQHAPARTWPGVGFGPARVGMLEGEP